MKKRRQFTSKQKAEIVLPIIQGEISLTESGRKHEIVPTLLMKWRDQAIENMNKAFEVNQESRETERKIKKYEHVITKITTQNDFLEKVLKTLD